jgi:two-component system chemotaxis sensor kinase CheA
VNDDTASNSSPQELDKAASPHSAPAPGELPAAESPVGELLIKDHSDTRNHQKEIASNALPRRVDARQLDELIHWIGKLVLERNCLAQLSRDFSSGISSGTAAASDLVASLAQSTARLGVITEELQTVGLKTRMVPIETVFHRFPRLVREHARSLQKQVGIILHGEDTELDRAMAELIGDPLLNLVQNAIEHGIEAPQVRVRAGKPRQGTICVEARRDGDQIVVTLSDDGAGIDAERVGRKAVEMGLVSPARLRFLSPREILDFIFLPGFSTIEKATGLSGRGAGLDVVRSNIRKLNGSVEIDSQPGRGTRICLRLPITLATVQVLLVQVAEEVYALPLRGVVETAHFNPQDLHSIEGREVLCFRSENLPLLRLQHLLDADAWPVAANPEKSARTGPQNQRVIVLRVGEKHIALLVDDLLGQESTVISPLEGYLQRCPSLAGAVIAGDGRVRLVLNPAGLSTSSTKPSLSARKAFA